MVAGPICASISAFLAAYEASCFCVALLSSASSSRMESRRPLAFISPRASGTRSAIASSPALDGLNTLARFSCSVIPGGGSGGRGAAGAGAGAGAGEGAEGGGVGAAGGGGAAAVEGAGGGVACRGAAGTSTE